MHDRRAWVTAGLLAVTCAVVAGSRSPVQAADTSVSEARTALDRLLRESSSKAERLAAAATVLRAPVLADPMATLEIAPRVAALDDSVGLGLVVRTLTEADVGSAATDRAREAWPAPDAVEAVDQRAARAAARWLLGERTVDPTWITGRWPPAPAVAAALDLDLGHHPVYEAGTQTPVGAVTDLLSREAPVLAALDDASADDAERMTRGLDRLVGDLKGQAADVLVAAVRRANALPGADGRTPRAARAALALGRLGDARVREDLEAALAGDDGWMRTVAASALGDLGDPGAAPALAWHLCVLSDGIRARDRWEYPGTSDTPIPASAWPNIDYFAVDAAACEALLRLGLPRATGYLIDRQLDPRRARYRIRVLQDATDALERHLPDSPARAFVPDAGIPQRQAAFEALASWWHERRDRTDLLSTSFDETAPSFRETSRGLVANLRRNDARRFIISKAAIELIGPPMTPALAEAAAAAVRPVARSEIALALGLVRDPRAVPSLLDLAADPRPMVRARAAVALGAYARSVPDALDMLLQLVHDPLEEVRVAALGGLVGAPRDARVADALATLVPDGRDAKRAYAVVRLVQEGPAAVWDEVEAGLTANTREQRHAWWDLVRRALDLPAYIHDAQSEPKDETARHLTREQVDAGWNALVKTGGR
ncbi:MAG: HEAT repeat domain-containing protein [Planctomycetota bacterium]